ncbi:MAG: hypothetical protein ACOZQL_04640 [Myxococcota bacterium]
MLTHASTAGDSMEIDGAMRSPTKEKVWFVVLPRASVAVTRIETAEPFAVAGTSTALDTSTPGCGLVKSTPLIARLPSAPLPSVAFTTT